MGECNVPDLGPDRVQIHILRQRDLRPVGILNLAACRGCPAVKAVALAGECVLRQVRRAEDVLLARYIRTVVGMEYNCVRKCDHEIFQINTVITALSTHVLFICQLQAVAFLHFNGIFCKVRDIFAAVMLDSCIALVPCLFYPDFQIVTVAIRIPLARCLVRESELYSFLKCEGNRRIRLINPLICRLQNAILHHKRVSLIISDFRSRFYRCGEKVVKRRAVVRTCLDHLKRIDHRISRVHAARE